MKITLLTASTSNDSYWNVLGLSAPNKLEYCLRHKIQLVIAEHKNYNAYTNWGERESFILDTLNSYDCDWAFFQGTDTLITNMTIDVRSLVNPEYDIIIGVDINGINNDSMFFQNTAKTKEFLDRTISLKNKLPNDQVAMAQVMKEMQDLRVWYVSQRMFNSMKYDEYGYGAYPQGNWQPGDFVIHFAGLTNEKRVALMSEYLNKITR